jgi:aromatic ring-opening dioxygenase catalytic subunit (LigB family)
MTRLPTVFLSHGSPTTALEEDGYTAAVRALAAWRPRAARCPRGP